TARAGPGRARGAPRRLGRPGTLAAAWRTPAPHSSCGRTTGAAPPSPGPRASRRGPGSPIAAALPLSTGLGQASRSLHCPLDEESALLGIRPQLLFEPLATPMQLGQD